MLSYHLFAWFLPRIRNKCVGKIVGNAGHLLVFAQCVRDRMSKCGTVSLIAAHIRIHIHIHIHIHRAIANGASVCGGGGTCVNMDSAECCQAAQRPSEAGGGLGTL